MRLGALLVPEAQKPRQSDFFPEKVKEFQGNFKEISRIFDDFETFSYFSIQFWCSTLIFSAPGHQQLLGIAVRAAREAETHGQAGAS